MKMRHPALRLCDEELMENGAAYSDVQNQLHIMLRKYVEENKRDEYRKVGGEIPYPVCMLFIGDRIREEAEEYIVPQMMRHWPSSFRQVGRDRLAIVFIDRNKEKPFRDLPNCRHYCLTAQEPLKTLENNAEDCKGINACIRELRNVISGADTGRMRIVAAVCVEDPDSLITGDVLAITEQFFYDTLNHNNISREGRVFAFLPDDFRSEEEFDQVQDFFIKWKKWTKRELKEEECPNVYMRFGSSVKRVTSVAPIVSRTLVFDKRDSNGILDSDHWRDRLTADVLETEMPVEGAAIQIPGTIPDKLNDEYVLLKAMDPANWRKPFENEETVQDTELLMQLMKSEMGDVDRSIYRWLDLACVARVESDARDNISRGSVLSMNEVESYCFGSSIRMMFREFEREFLGRPLPDSLNRLVASLRSSAQTEAMEETLNLIIRQTSDRIPERVPSDRPIQYLPEQIWRIKDDYIVPAYAALAPKCEEVLIHKWALRCREKVRDVREGIRKKNDLLEQFSEIQKHEVASESSFWNEVNYTGPNMDRIDARDIADYTNAVINVMKQPEEKNFRELFRIVRAKILDPNYPYLGSRIRAICHTSSASSLQADASFTIDSGVSQGKKITFTDVKEFGFIRFLRECDRLRDLKTEEV